MDTLRLCILFETKEYLCESCLEILYFNSAGCYSPHNYYLGYEYAQHFGTVITNQPELSWVDRI